MARQKARKIPERMVPIVWVLYHDYKMPYRRIAQIVNDAGVKCTHVTVMNTLRDEYPEYLSNIQVVDIMAARESILHAKEYFAFYEIGEQAATKKLS
jgi:hypothetical protein